MTTKIQSGEQTSLLEKDDTIFRRLKQKVTYTELCAIIRREEKMHDYPGLSAILERTGWVYDDYFDAQYNAGVYSSCRGF